MIQTEEKHLSVEITGNTARRTTRQSQKLRQKDTEPRASASGYVKVKLLVSNSAVRFSNIRLLTRAALFTDDPS